MTTTGNVAESAPSIGLFAKIWASLMIFANGWNIYRMAMIIDDFLRHSDPRWKEGFYWILPSSIAVSALAIVAYAAVLMRLKLGVYFVGILACAAFMLNLYIRTPVAVALVGLVGFGILLVALRPRWGALR